MIKINFLWRLFCLPSIFFGLILVLNDSLAFAQESVVGIIWPITGEASRLSSQGLVGMNKAISGLSTEEKSNIRFEFIDNKSRKGGSIEAFNKAKDIGANIIIAPPWTGQASEVVPLSWSKNIPVILLSASNRNLVKPGKPSFRIGLGDDIQAEALATFVSEKLKKKQAIVIYQENEYSTGLKDTFSEIFNKTGGSIVSNIPFDAFVHDGAKWHLERIEEYSKSNGKEVVVFLPLYSKDARAAIQMLTEAQSDSTFVIGDGFGEEFFLNGGSSLKNIYAISFSEQTIDEKEKSYFSQKFSPNKESITKGYNGLLMGHDAITIAVKALSLAKNNFSQNEIVSQLRTTQFDGIAGPIKFNEKGERTSPVGSIVSISNGSMSFVDDVKTYVRNDEKRQNILKFLKDGFLGEAVSIMVAIFLFLFKHKVVKTALFLRIRDLIVSRLIRREKPVSTDRSKQLIYVSSCGLDISPDWVFDNIVQPVRYKLQQENIDLEVLFEPNPDKSNINWFKATSNYINSSVLFVPIFSPKYFGDHMCEYELEHSFMNNRTNGKPYIFPLNKGNLELDGPYKHLSPKAAFDDIEVPALIVAEARNLS